MALEISQLTKHTFRARIDPGKIAGVPQNPSADPVAMAFVSTGLPAPGDFKTAFWDVDATVSPTVYEARCLIGGTGTGATAELAVGTYTVYVKITDSPEVPVLIVGQLEVI